LRNNVQGSISDSSVNFAIFIISALNTRNPHKSPDIGTGPEVCESFLTYNSRPEYASGFPVESNGMKNKIIIIRGFYYKMLLCDFMLTNINRIINLLSIQLYTLFNAGENNHVNSPIQRLVDKNSIRLTWACRFLDDKQTYEISYNKDNSPIPGDVALFRVTRIGLHTRIINALNQKLRIYSGDFFVGVFGNRYATDALEAEVDGVRNLSLLTAAGMVGTVKSKHASVPEATKVAFSGYLNNSQNRINSKKIISTVSKVKNRVFDKSINLVVVVGSGMNAGKTTFCRKVIKSLTQKGVKVAACKLTGSVSPRDYDEMRSANAVYVSDFSDYGFPSTYKCEREELMALFETMTADLTRSKPDVIIMEIADGVLQQETKIILNDDMFKKLTRRIIVTADSSTAALYTVQYLQRLGYRIYCISGSITSSPLYVKEFKDHHTIPVISSKDNSIDFDSITERLVQFNQRVA
jgi:molybdopterin-guanine dinucleotide biosynthesis protein